MTWLEKYLKYTSNMESPEVFHRWIGLFALASVTQRKIWLDRGSYRVYPNLYVINIAESGGCRKSGAARPGIRFIHEASKEITGMKVFHERVTLEGVLEVLKKESLIIQPEQQITKENASQKIVDNGAITLIADELTNLFNKSNYSKDLFSFFTAAYSSQDVLNFLTRNKGEAEVKNPYICMLASTTPDQLADAFPDTVRKTGFLARVVLVLGKSRNVRLFDSSLINELHDELLEYLIKVGNVYGSLVFSKNCYDYAKLWYGRLPHDCPMGILPAFYERIHDHVFKIATLLSLSESLDMTIHRRHFKEALDMIMNVGVQMEHAMRYIGASKVAEARDELVRLIKSNPDGISHSALLKAKHRMFTNQQEFRDTIEMLVETGRIVIVKCSSIGGGTFIKYQSKKKGKK